MMFEEFHGGSLRKIILHDYIIAPSFYDIFISKSIFICNATAFYRIFIANYIKIYNLSRFVFYWTREIGMINPIIYKHKLSTIFT